MTSEETKTTTLIEELNIESVEIQVTSEKDLTLFRTQLKHMMVFDECLKDVPVPLTFTSADEEQI